MNFNFIKIAVFSIFLSGCFLAPIAELPEPNWNNPIETKSRVIVENDNFEKIVKYTGPIMRIVVSPVEVQNISLRSKTSLKTGNTLFQIYTSNTYSDYDWRFYDKAYSSEGDKLEVTLISKDVDCYKNRCSHIEKIGIDLTRDYLEKHSETGIKYKVIGKSGSGIFFLPAAYIKGFLSAVPNN